VASPLTILIQCIGIILVSCHDTVTAELFVVIGQLAEAAEKFELCYSLTKRKTDWLSTDGEASMHSVSCNNLTRIYTSIASQYSEQNDQESMLQYLILAYDKSKEGESLML